ncbi:MAG: prepilin peptidase [Syntrophobacteraceae bacterium]|nr:prepilin peptidase [Syntrophobacteraceae bacterium]
MNEPLVASIPLIGGQIASFVAGAILGSFYNVVIHRLPLGQSIVRPGSRCPSCGNALAAYDNIPLLSFLILGGKCRHCGSAISNRYPLVEAISAILALVLFRRYGLHPQLPIEFIFCSLLLIITMIDLDTMEIPNVLSIPGIALGFGFSFLTPRLSWSGSLLGIALGGGVFYLIAVLFYLVRRKEGLGGGDIKLLAMIGAFLGWKGVIFTILVSSVSGIIIAIPLMWRSGNGLGSALPFGPFLALGAVSYVFWGQLFFHWYFSTLLGM